ncbi:ribosomal protein L11 methyltransferase [Sphingomonas jejuensis]|uniref:Ribosomal protein L11 methyltransferase n=1 Tax=Sphingomonas jejuensis TaxID=904715 RepID=A0ABX0XMK3_9SPHN|nr:50S ribosomal protein L11 methyltransferase [Sphingomonas jejuensis]NJC34470.1 ribosomal protein L11 methyltransferase [Sphingomonas jejuensis]
MSDSWKLSLPCTRAEAEAIDAGDGVMLDPPPVLATLEEVVDDAERWRLDAYFEAEPDAAAIAAIQALVPSASGTAPTIERLPAEDWVTLSQAGLEPLRVGRFVVHTPAHPADAPPGGRAFLIDAGQAFGTGHHETTSGCLAVIDAMAGTTVARAIDVGTGTGLLAFAAAALWPDALVMATDNDPIAIDVTRENAAINGFATDRFALVVADGARDPAITGAAPFDLVIANILAGPLIAMAAELTAIAAPGGTILLAGLLTRQRDEVLAAYRAQGCAPADMLERGDWSILRLSAPSMPVAAGPAAAGDRSGWATDGDSPPGAG